MYQSNLPILSIKIMKVLYILIKTILWWKIGREIKEMALNMFKRWIRIRKIEICNNIILSLFICFKDIFL